MVAKREICITEDPYAYDEAVVNDYDIAAGFVTASDWIAYPGGTGYAHTAAFKTLRVNQHDDAVSRDTIREESTDQVSVASLFGGTISPKGSFSGAFRGYDFHTTGLLRGIMGYQTPATVASPATGFAAGYRYELTMVPATLAIKIVDEAAKLTSGAKGSTTVYRGVGISSFELKLAAKQYATSTIQWLSRKPEVYDEAVNSNTEPTGDPALFYNAVLKWTPEGGSATPFKCIDFSMSINRPIDTDDYSIGSQFLANLSYNGLTELGGDITLSGTDWDKIRAMYAGSNSDLINTLDQGKREYFGSVTNTTTSNVLANAIPAGKLEILLHSPDGTRVISRITCDQAKLTEASRSAQGIQRWNKTVKWMAITNNTSKFYVDVWNPV
jgi:hypothetical protein